MFDTVCKLTIPRALVAAIMAFGAFSLSAQSAELPRGSLIDRWLDVPQVGQIDWPYSYIRTKDVARQERTRRSDVFSTIDRLKFRLDDAGYSNLVKAVSAWKVTLAKTTHYRTPGNWSPSWLMSHPNQRPPTHDVEAIGYCKPSSRIEIWDADGVHSVAWRSGLSLSDVMQNDPSIKGGDLDEVAVIFPKGEVNYYGVASWNYDDALLLPGARIVGAVSLGGQVFPWLRDAIVNLLAHTPVGHECLEFDISREIEQ